MDKIPAEDWNLIVDILKRSESAFYAYANTEDIQYIKRARELLKFKTMVSSSSAPEEIMAEYTGVWLLVTMSSWKHTVIMIMLGRWFLSCW